MKNFYEATGIRPNLTLKIVLEVKAIGTCPCQIKINDQLEFYGELVGTNMFIKHVPINDPIAVNITVDRSHPHAVEILNLKIDDYQILPLYCDLAVPPTTYIDFTGTWDFKIFNFYPWYHEITGQGWIA